MGQEHNSDSGPGETVVGWEPGQYEKQESNREWILRAVVFGIAAMCICSMIAAAIGAYFYL